MDHVVHISNGNGAAMPLVLRLLPGEETIFNLKVVNHGEPSNISLHASSPVFKAVRLKKPDHYVVTEEVIPVLARMPANEKRLEGEILVSGSGAESRVPITLLRDSEDPGLQGDEELKDDYEEDEDADLAARGRDGRDREDADDEDGDEEDYESVKRAKQSEEEDELEKEPRRIAFSRDRDLQRYRSATRQQRVEDRHYDPNDDRSYSDANDNNGRLQARPNNRIDDSFVDPGNRQEEGPRFIPRQAPLQGQEERQESTSGHEDSYQVFSQDPDSESREIPISIEMEEEVPEQPEEYIGRDDEPQSLLGKLGGFGSFGSLQVIPAGIFLSLVIILVLTFITESIPEFPGALTSSILIVTLIIYGAATLLKA